MTAPPQCGLLRYKTIIRQGGAPDKSTPYPRRIYQIVIDGPVGTTGKTAAAFDCRNWLAALDGHLEKLSDLQKTSPEVSMCPPGAILCS
jgi:hypothetical protein